MCSICDGATHEEVRIQTRERIERFGFTVRGVEPGLDHPSWLYTVGLVERYNHPEFAVFDFPVDEGYQVLDAAARGVLAGDRYAAGETALLGGDRLFHIDDLDERVVAGEMMAQWHDFYATQGDLGLRLSVLELVLCGRYPR